MTFQIQAKEYYSPIVKGKKMVQKLKNWGGKRPNAGLPKIENGRRVLATLTESQIQTATSLGKGNISAGIRLALDQVKK
jgi:hypothetical protein